MIDRPITEWVRRATRNRTSVTGVAYRADGSWVRVHMNDISYDGCHLLIDQQFDVGETLTLVLPRMRHMKVQVRWTRDGQAGIRFLGTTARDDRRARIGV